MFLTPEQMQKRKKVKGYIIITLASVVAIALAVGASLLGNLL
ncbi:hypothetical protein [Alkalihalobacillus deserti]|nr:hypothetical protein [Alkalihalobacillus deserti]